MDFIQTKYIYELSPSLRNFRKKGDNLYNFSCPICGDSHKDKRKARGYIYEDDNGEATFKCHNCGKVNKLEGLIYFVDPELYKQYKFESFKEANTSTYFVKDTKSQIENLNSQIALENYISKAISNDVAIKYLEMRKIPKEKWDQIYYSNDLNIIKPIFKNKNYENTKFGIEPRIILPVYSINNNLIGIISRSMLKKATLRYINLRFDTNEPFVYNLNKVNMSKQKFIFEGSFDSMFFDNSIAVDGADFNKVSEWIKKEEDILVYDNDARNKQIINNMEKMGNIGYNVFVWPKEMRMYKDINDCVIGGMGINNINEFIQNNSFNSLKLKLNMAEWKKI